MITWTDEPGERHDFTAEELDPSRTEVLDEASPRPHSARAETSLDGVELDPSTDLFDRMRDLEMARRFKVAPTLQRVWGDDLFLTHLLQSSDPSDWLDGMVREREVGNPRRLACDRFYLRDPDAFAARRARWMTHGPLYVDHPRRRAIVREDITTEPAVVSDAEATRVSDALKALRDKRITPHQCEQATRAAMRLGRAVPVELAARWLADVTERDAPVTASSNLEGLCAGIEACWGTFTAPLVQRVFGDDRFVAAVASRFYAHHWLASVAPMTFEAPARAEDTLVAWWTRFGHRQRSAMAEVLPDDALIDEVFNASRAMVGPGSTLERPALLYLKRNTASLRAALQRMADEKASPSTVEVGWFLGRFGFDIDGLFTLVVNRCSTFVWYLLPDMLDTAMRVRSPAMVPHLAALIRRKGARERIEPYLLGEGANVVEGLLSMVTSKASAQKFALEWLGRIAAEPRGHALIRERLETRDAKVKRLVEPLTR